MFTAKKYNNFKYFYTLTDSLLAKKYNCTVENIRALRKKYVPETNTHDIRKSIRQNVIDQKLKSYIRKHKNKIAVKECISEIGFTNLITKNYLIKFAKRNKIKIEFKTNNTTFKHGIYIYQYKKCRCKICKLANAIRHHFYYFGMKIESKIIDMAANNFIKEYQSEKSKSKFYSRLEFRLKKHIK